MDDTHVSDELAAVIDALEKWMEWAAPFRAAGQAWTPTEEALWLSVSAWIDVVAERMERAAIQARGD